MTTSGWMMDRVTLQTFERVNLTQDDHNEPMSVDDWLNQQAQQVRNELLDTATPFGEKVSEAVLGCPWDISNLGPPRQNTQELALVSASVLEAGRRRSLTVDGLKVHWYDREDDVFQMFFEHLRSAVNQSWDDFFSALNSLRHNPEFRRLSQPLAPLSAEEEVQFKRLSDLARFLDDVAVDALNRSWRDVFSNGHVLVFEETPHGLEFKAPQMWSDGPPIEPRTLEDLKAEVDEERKQRLEQRYPSLKRIFDLNLTLEFGSAGQAGKQKRAFLLSKDLDPIFDACRVPQQSEGGPRDATRRRVEAEVEAWFKEGIADGANWSRRKERAIDAIKDEAERRGETSFGRAAERIWSRSAPDSWKKDGAPFKQR